MDDESLNLKNIVFDIISCYDDEYAKELGISELTDEDINQIINNILDNDNITYEIQEEIEDYANTKKCK